MSSSVGAPAAPRMVFVDDTDSNFQYNGFDWHLQTYTTANDTSFSALPLYGTLHFTQPLGSDTNVVYTYQGSSMQAKFITTDLTKVTCTLDGQPQLVSSLDTLGGAQCVNNGTVTDGTHKLTVGLDGSGSTAQPLSLFFDGLFYEPSLADGPPNGADVFVSSGDSALTLGQVEGATEWHWDFEFVGYSMSLYINFNSELSVIPTNGSYTLDRAGPYNFSTPDPLFASTAPQILVQTPRSELGQHSFHLDYTHQGEVIPFSFYGITVQNSTTSVDVGLQVIPPVPSTTPVSNSTGTSKPSSPAAPGTTTATNPTQPHTSSHIPVIVGTIIAVLGVLSILLITWFILRRRRRARAEALRLEEEDIDEINPPAIRPFQRRSVLDAWLHPKTQSESSSEQDSGRNPSYNERMGAAARAQQVRVVIHEDSGADVAQPRREEPEEEEIVELPPNYGSLWRRVTGARGAQGEHATGPTTRERSGDVGDVESGVVSAGESGSSLEKHLLDSMEKEKRGQRIVFNRDS